MVDQVEYDEENLNSKPPCIWKFGEYIMVVKKKKLIPTTQLMKTMSQYRTQGIMKSYPYRINQYMELQRSTELKQPTELQHFAQRVLTIGWVATICTESFAQRVSTINWVATT